MKKTLLSISFLVLSAQFGFAGVNPFDKASSKSGVKEKVLEQQMKMLPLSSQLANQRVASVTPDSVTLYEHDGASWTLTNTAKVTYNSSGKYSLITIYLPPPFSIPVLMVSFEYNAAGKLTLIEQVQTLPAPTTIFKLEQYFDANQNLTSTKVYEDDNGALLLVEGDSLVYTYSGTTIDGVVTGYYDDLFGAWKNDIRVQGMQYNANAEPISLDIQEWDEQMSSWSAEIIRFTSVAWGFGYNSIVESFGIAEIGADDFLSVMPTVFYEGQSAPTNYLVTLLMGSMTDTLERSTHQITGGLVSQLVFEEYLSGAWEPSYRANYTYDSNNRMLSILEEDYNGLTWENSYRYTWEFNSQGHLTKEIDEGYFMSNWMIFNGNEYAYQYTIANIPFEVITSDFDFGTSSFALSERRIYNFGSFPTAVPDFSKLSITAFPNPVVDQLTIQTNLEKSEILNVEVLNVAGQLVYQQRLMSNAGVSQHAISFEAFEQGIYMVRLSTTDATKVIRIVK